MLRRIGIDSVVRSRLFGNDLIRAESASRVSFFLFPGRALDFLLQYGRQVCPFLSAPAGPEHHSES